MLLKRRKRNKIHNIFNNNNNKMFNNIHLLRSHLKDTNSKSMLSKKRKTISKKTKTNKK